MIPPPSIPAARGAWLNGVVSQPPNKASGDPPRQGGVLGLGHVFGIPVQAHWSVAVIMGVIAWNLSTSTFASWYPTAPWLRVLVGIGASAVFLAGLLAHEIAHAAVAKRLGVEVDSITLWLFGGVAQLRSEADRPSVELRIAGAGPAVSVGIGLVAGLLSVVLTNAGLSGAIIGVLDWLCLVNLVLAAFNLIPAAPLDGGRLLHAALWQWRGSSAWASSAAATCGRVFGVLLIAAGVAQIALTQSWSAAWPAVMGWFVFTAASAERRQAGLAGALESLTARDVMSADPETVRADITVAELIDAYVLRRQHSTFPLVDATGLVGLVTLRRINAVPPQLRAAVAARDIACPLGGVVAATPDQRLSELLPRLRASPDGRALVFDGGRLVGVISPSDISRAIEFNHRRGPVPPR